MKSEESYIATDEMVKRNKKIMERVNRPDTLMDKIMEEVREDERTDALIISRYDERQNQSKSS